MTTIFPQPIDALPKQTHAAQVGFVLQGKIELTMGGACRVFEKGDRYFIPEGVPHSGKIHAGCADTTLLDEPARYCQKPTERIEP